jgi:hypothetical protein
MTEVMMDPQAIGSILPAWLLVVPVIGAFFDFLTIGKTTSTRY